jgi:hypothetical protein
MEGTAMTNREFSKTDEVFQRCCKEAGVEPTKRQASKYRAFKGRAFAMRQAVLARIEK